MQREILVIKLSSLGDFIQALGSLAAIRRYHEGDRVTLLTTKPLRELAERCGLFDEIWIDPRAPFWRPDLWLALRSRLSAQGFARIYDLQWSDRSSHYFRMLKRPRPEWVGVAPGCSHRLEDPSERIHIRDRQAKLLRLAGIEEVPAPDLSFLGSDVSRYGIEGPYALLVPGSSPGNRWRRWPIQRYVEVALALAERGIAPVLICGPAERDEAEAIASACPAAYDIQTNRDEIVELARGATLAISNDTGPCFLIGATGCPLIMVYGAGSDPVKLAPPGEHVIVVKHPSLDDLPLSDVLDAVDRILAKTGPGSKAAEPASSGESRA